MNRAREAEDNLPWRPSPSPSASTIWRAEPAASLPGLRVDPAEGDAADVKTHNAEAILFRYYRVLGDPLWQRFNGGAEGTRWHYGALASVFSQTMPGRLSDRLSRAVVAFSI